MVDFSKLLNAIDNTSTRKQSYDDDKADLWTPTVDKAGNGTAIIRFLPDANVEEIPFVRMYSYGFKSEQTNRWYIENSLQTIGKPDPAQDYWSKWYNSNDPDEKQIARTYLKRRINYYSNVLVVSDPANPENEGKVFKFRYGQKIFDKIVAAAKPDFADDQPVNVFDPENGADFRMKIKNVAGYRNYDDCTFAAPKPIRGDIDSILANCHDLQAMVAPDQFKSYDELKDKLDKVLGLTDDTPIRRTTKKAEDDVDSFMAEATKVERKAPPAVTERPVPAAVSNDDDDDLDFFKSLVDD